MSADTYPFAVDRYLRIGVDTQLLDLGYIAGALHVRGITTGAEDTRNACLRVYVVGRDQRPRRIASQGDDLRRHGLPHRIL